MEVSMRKLLLAVAAVVSLAAADNWERDAFRVVQEIPWPSEWTGFGTKKECMEEKLECTFEFLNADELKVTFDSNSESGYYRLDSRAVPPTIDLRERADSKTLYFGIYSIGNETLSLCFSRESESRPSEFSTQDSKGGEALVTLKRKKP
jgi:uncharacterized protein (TIGR03067 family)